MKWRLLIACLWSVFLVGSSASAAEDFKGRMQEVLQAWETLDPAKVAPFYAQEPDRAFYDIAPLKYTGWAEYADGVKKLAAGWASLKFTLGDDVRTEQRGNVAWGTATLRADIVGKDGSKQSVEGRWTILWEKVGKQWLVVHEHTSVPWGGPPPLVGQSLYKRLGGYDAIAAVTDEFIGRLATDPDLKHFFVGHSTDSLHRIRQLVADQLCAATGGPCIYIGRDMKTAHAGLGITEKDWETSVNHLVATLDKFQVPAKEKDEVLSALSGLKKDIVTSPGGGR